jgi:hypothetical protein
VASLALKAMSPAVYTTFLDHFWRALNSPFVIFILGSVAVAGLARYWDLRQAQRYEARDNYRYVLECAHRIEFVLQQLPSAALISMYDWWSANNALHGHEENTFYRPLFKEFNEQSIQALVTYLAISNAKYRLAYADVLETVDAQSELVDGLHVVDKQKESEAESGEDMEGLAQLWTYWQLPEERVERLEQIKQSYERHLEFLERMRNLIEKRL